MRKSMFRVLAAGLSLAPLPAAVAAVGSDFCDLSWVGTGISAAPTDSGHLVALRGTDGLLRLNEWKNSTKTWSGWMVPSNQKGELTQPWLQFKAENGTNWAQNLYVIGTTDDSIHQWVLTRSGNTWSGLNGRTAVNFANITPINSVTSFQSDIAGHQDQKLIALNSNGTIWTRTWDPTRSPGWDASWTQLGTLGNVVGSPYAIQLTPNTANLYVRTSGGLVYQQYWNGTSWLSNWLLVPDSPSPAGDLVSLFPDNTNYLYSISSGNSAEGMVYAGGSWGGWSTFSLQGPNVALDATKPMAGVAVPGTGVAYSVSAIYGIDKSGVVWRAISSGNTVPGNGVPVNCPQPQVAP